MTAQSDRPEGQGGYHPPPGYGPLPGYGSMPQAAPSYGPPGYVQLPQTETQAVVVLVLGIASFVVFPVIPAIVALCLAPGARRSIERSNGWKTGRGMVTGGVVASWINVALAVLVIGGIFAFAAPFSSGEGYSVPPDSVSVPR